MKEIIIEKPVLDTIDKIEKTNKSGILLAGEVGSGKSTVLDVYKKIKKDDLVVDCTLDAEDYINIPDNNIFRLYIVCMLLNKILKHIKSNYPEYFEPFFKYLAEVRLTLSKIKSMYLTGIYDKKQIILDDLYLNPEALLDNFLEDSLKVFGNNTFKVILDNFDVRKVSDEEYQKEMYDLLRNRTNYILAVSDKRLQDDDFRSHLVVNNDIVDVNYSFDVKYVREILDQMIVNELIRVQGFDFRKRVVRFLSDEELEELIRLANGSIIYMFWALSSLVEDMADIPRENYMVYIRNFFEERKEIYGLIGERRLYI